MAEPNTDTSDAARKLPRTFSSQTLPQDIRSLFPQDIDDTMRRYGYYRDEYVHSIFQRKAEEITNKWCEVKCTTDELEEQITDAKDRYDIPRKFKIARCTVSVYQGAFLFFNYATLPDIKPHEEVLPENVKGLIDIVVIPDQDNIVTKKYYDEDPQSPRYGELDHITLTIKVGDGQGTTKLDVHHSWFMYLQLPGIDGSHEGHPEIDYLYNAMYIKHNIDFALGEGIFQHGNIKEVLFRPATKESQDWCEENYRHMTIQDRLDFPVEDGQDKSTWDYKRIGVTGAQHNPAPTIQYLQDRMSAGSRMAKSVLSGARSGQILGAKYNFKDYLSGLTDDQMNTVDPWFRELIDRWRLTGIITAEGDIIEIKWNNLFELDEEEQAAVDKQHAETMNLTSTMLLNMSTIGFFPVVHDDKLWLVGHGGKIPVEYVDASSDLSEMDSDVLSFAPPPGAPTPAPQPPPTVEDRVHLSNVKMSHDEKMEYEKWNFENPALDRAFEADLLKAMNEYYNRKLAVVEQAFEGLDQSEVKVQDSTVKNASYAEISDTILETKIPAGEIEDVLDEYLGQSWIYGANQTALAMKVATTYNPDMPEVRKYIDENRGLLKHQITGTIDDTFLDGMQEGIRRGEPYDQISKRITKAYGDATKNMPNTVRKITHGTIESGKAESFLNEGETHFTFVTMGDDRVRDEHMARHGDVFEAAAYPEYLALTFDWNCRCEIRPLTIIEKEAVEVPL